ncbi:5906_t:CDS:2, partial [Gigaspora rosea]
DKWHSVFQKEIWLQRCDEVAKWKKELEIDSKVKGGKVSDKGKDTPLVAEKNLEDRRYQIKGVI